MNKIKWHKVRTYSLSNRQSKTSINNYVLPVKKQIPNLQNWFPPVLAGKNFADLIHKIKLARQRNKPVIFMCGAHLIKCGLSLLVNDLIKRKFITHIAVNGAFIIHDFEVAYVGHTSEDVAETLKTGKFGMVKETGEFLNITAKAAADTNQGLGVTLGLRMAGMKKLKFPDYSIAITTYQNKVPLTVHVAIGTDIIYQHPSCDGAAWGQASYTDFLRLTESVIDLNEGGVVINFGSAVLLPEVFLKTLNLARNMGYPVKNFTAANFDMINQYRARVNVIERPTEGKGYYFIGHHEIMLPLLYYSLISS